MLSKRTGLIVITMLALVSQACKSNSVHNIFINEVMQSNIDYLIVENDYPDSWVELYNAAEQSINIKGYYIGLTSNYKDAYCISRDSIIPPHGFIVIYCDKENRGLHTNFRIDSGKGDLFFFSPNGELIDELHLKKMLAPNLAYGRIEDGHDEWQYEVTPTAGYPNAGKGANLLLPDPVFSIKGGLYTEPLSITISIPDYEVPNDTRIYVTTDGSEPTELSESTGKSITFNINNTTIVRAKLISSNSLPGRSVTHSYIFYQCQLPILSMVTDSRYLYNEEIGILLGGEDNKGNCYNGWRRPINAEYFDIRISDESLFNQLCETSVSGHYTRTYPQKSMKLYAHKRFGKKRFEGRFWEEKPNVDQVKSFMIRNGGTGCLYGRFHDAITQRVFGRHIDCMDWQAYQPIVLFINGIYKGVFGMRERSEEDYIESNYGIDEDDIEIQNERCYYSPQERENTLFQDLYNTYTKPVVTYKELADMIDVDNFVVTLIAEMFSTNYDYPYNNISMWRELKDGEKWRWILKDLDYTGLRKSVNYNMFHYIMNTGEEGSEEYNDANNRDDRMIPSLKLYQVMMSFPEVREKFIDLFTVYLGDFLKPSVTIPMIEQMDREISTEMESTFNAYDFSKYYGVYEEMEDFDYLIDPVDHYHHSVERIKQFWCQRPRIVYQQMSEYFKLGDCVDLEIKPSGQSVIVNGVELTEGDFEGCCFSNKSFKLDADATNMHWNITFFDSKGRVICFDNSNRSTEVSIKEIPNWKDISSICCELVDGETSITHRTFNQNDSIIYSVSGIRTMNIKKGINIIKDQDQFIKVAR